MNDLKKNKVIILGIISAAVIITILISAVYTIKRVSLGRKLKELQDITAENSVKFFNKYSHSDAEGIESVKASLENKDYELTPMDDVIELLKEYPRDYDEAIARRDIFSTSFGFPLFGTDVWDRFVGGCRVGRSGNLVMVQFAADMVPVYYFLEFDGTTYHIVEDRSSDSEDGESGYSEWYAKYLKVEGYEAEAGYAEYAYLTNDPLITYKDIDNYYKQEDSSEEDAPSVFMFYLGVVTNDIMQTSMVTPEKVDGDFELDYTGFTDRHPSYAEDNPRMDYDGDGILDRVFRDHVIIPDGDVTTDDDETSDSAYLMLGNGKTLVLAENMWGDRMQTKALDMTKDGINDISFVQYNDEEYGPVYYEYVEGGYELCALPEEKYLYFEAIDNDEGDTFFKCVDSGSVKREFRRIDGEWVVN
ncbi:MAG: hypothetical protein K5888_00370 [Lachnospiraceae bacterium]|nr:hypothetical protein [Lachnospiraceae bacterium]